MCRISKYNLFKTVFLVFIFSYVFTIGAQDITFYASGKGQVFGSTIVNRTITDDENQNYSFALSGAGGVGGAFYLFDKIGLSLDFLIGNHKAVYNASELTANDIENNFQSTISYRSIHLPILLSVRSGGKQKKDEGMGYLEVGPQFNNCMLASYTRNDGFDESISEWTSNSYWSGILGFGMVNSLGRRSAFDFTLGLRIEYGFGDLGSVDAFGTPFDNDNGYKTFALGVGLQLGVSYQLPIETNASWLRFLK